MASAACADTDLRPDSTNLDRVEAAVLCLHNQERKASGVHALTRNRRLDASATAHSADMVARQYFEHDTPSGLTPFQRMRRNGYIRKGAVWNAGENIGWGSGTLSTPRSMFDAWMESTGHRLTLLASDFSDVGIGISLGAPNPDFAHLTSAATYTLDFGWRQARETTRKRGLCQRRPAKCRGKS